MKKQTVSLRLDAKKVEELDALAESLDRDRSYLINEAVDAYLDVQQWQIEQIKEGLRLAEEGSLVDHATVKKLTRQWRKG
jgi:RHH-type rel operon transcriptional repressor/antitoxin RelB